MSKLSSIFEANKVVILLFVVLLPSVFITILGYCDLRENLENTRSEHVFSSDDLLNVGSVSVDDPKFELILRASLERDIVELRHKRTIAYATSRAWTRFISMLLGTFSLAIGACFILAQISSPKFLAEVASKGVKATVASSSPGLILAVCGVALMIVPNISNQPINTNDTSSYLSPNAYTSSYDTRGTRRVLSAQQAKQEYCASNQNKPECQEEPSK